jgi:predicted PurR-regulated permease PerM
MSIEKSLLLAGIVLFSVLAVLMILPYEQYVLLAVLLGYLLYPLQRRLRGHIGTRISAGLLIVGTVLLIVIPIGLLLGIAVQQATTILNDISRGEFGVGAVESILRERTGISYSRT